MHATSQLDNKLTVVTERIPGARSVSIGILVDAGPHDEPENKLGVAHLLEHALFLGTSGRDARQISGMIDEAGGQMGAFTSRDYTCLYAHIMDDYCTFAWDLLGDMLLNSTFPEEALMRERDVVLQELGMYQDDPARNIHEVLKRSIWPDHPLGRLVAGSPETVSELTREDVIYFAGQNYLPDRMVVAAVGNIDHADAISQAEDAFWRLLGQSNTREIPPAEFSSAITVLPSGVSHSHFALAMPSDAYNSSDRYSIHALNSILGSGMSSRLYSKLREDLGLVYDIHSSYHAYRAGGTVVVEGICSPENLQQILTTSIQELKKIATDGVSQDELWRTKMQIRGQHQLASDSLHTRMSRVLTQQLYFGQTLPEEEVIDGFTSVSCDTVQKAAQRMLDAERFGLTVCGDADATNSETQLRELMHSQFDSQLV